MKWKEIPDTDGQYLISDDGKVFSAISNKLIHQEKSNTGYYRVEIRQNGERKKYSVHRLVAETFIPNPNNLPCINHKDECCTNNCVDNLEWCTHKYNSNYGTSKERMSKNHKYYYGKDNIHSKTVYQFDLEGNFIAEYGSTREAERITGYRSANISRVCNGERSQYDGYYWSYEKEFNYVQSKNHKIKTVPIQQYDLEGNFIREYDCSTDFNKHGFDAWSVRLVCDGKMYKHKGYTFKYKENNL